MEVSQFISLAEGSIVTSKNLKPKKVKDTLSKLCNHLSTNFVDDNSLHDVLVAIQSIGRNGGESLLKAYYRNGLFGLIEVLFTVLQSHESEDGGCMAEQMLETLITLAECSLEGKLKIIEDHCNKCLELLLTCCRKCIHTFEVLRDINILLEDCPLNLKEKLIKDGSIFRNIKKLAEMLNNSGDYEFQVGLLEFLFRIIPRRQREEILKELFEKSLVYNGILRIRDSEFETDCRLFLNEFNSKLAESQRVISLPCNTSFLGDKELLKPDDPGYDSFWVDFNTGSERITMFCLPDRDSQQSIDDQWETLSVWKTDISRYDILTTDDYQIVNIKFLKPIAELYPSQQNVQGKVLQIQFSQKWNVDEALELTFGKGNSGLNSKSCKVSAPEIPLCIQKNEEGTKADELSVIMKPEADDEMTDIIPGSQTQSERSWSTRRKVSVPRIPMSITMSASALDRGQNSSRELHNVHNLTPDETCDSETPTRENLHSVKVSKPISSWIDQKKSFTQATTCLTDSDISNRKTHLDDDVDVESIPDSCPVMGSSVNADSIKILRGSPTIAVNAVHVNSQEPVGTEAKNLEENVEDDKEDTTAMTKKVEQKNFKKKNTLHSKESEKRPLKKNIESKHQFSADIEKDNQDTLHGRENFNGSLSVCQYGDNKENEDNLPQKNQRKSKIKGRNIPVQSNTDRPQDSIKARTKIYKNDRKEKTLPHENKVSKTRVIQQGFSKLDSELTDIMNTFSLNKDETETNVAEEILKNVEVSENHNEKEIPSLDLPASERTKRKHHKKKSADIPVKPQKSKKVYNTSVTRNTRDKTCHTIPDPSPTKHTIESPKHGHKNNAENTEHGYVSPIQNVCQETSIDDGLKTKSTDLHEKDPLVSSEHFSSQECNLKMTKGTKGRERQRETNGRERQKVVNRGRKKGGASKRNKGKSESKAARSDISTNQITKQSVQKRRVAVDEISTEKYSVASEDTNEINDGVNRISSPEDDIESTSCMPLEKESDISVSHSNDIVGEHKSKAVSSKSPVLDISQPHRNQESATKCGIFFKERRLSQITKDSFGFGSPDHINSSGDSCNTGTNTSKKYESKNSSSVQKNVLLYMSYSASGCQETNMPTPKGDGGYDPYDFDAECARYAGKDGIKKRNYSEKFYSKAYSKDTKIMKIPRARAPETRKRKKSSKKLQSKSPSLTFETNTRSANRLIPKEKTPDSIRRKLAELDVIENNEKLLTEKELNDDLYQNDIEMSSCRGKRGRRPKRKQTEICTREEPLPYTCKTNENMTCKEDLFDDIHNTEIDEPNHRGKQGSKSKLENHHCKEKPLSSKDAPGIVIECEDDSNLDISLLRLKASQKSSHEKAQDAHSINEDVLSNFSRICQEIVTGGNRSNESESPQTHDLSNETPSRIEVNKEAENSSGCNGTKSEISWIAKKSTKKQKRGKTYQKKQKHSELQAFLASKALKELKQKLQKESVRDSDHEDKMTTTDEEEIQDQASTQISLETTAESLKSILARDVDEVCSIKSYVSSLRTPQKFLEGFEEEEEEEDIEEEEEEFNLPDDVKLHCLKVLVSGPSTRLKPSNMALKRKFQEIDTESEDSQTVSEEDVYNEAEHSGIRPRKLFRAHTKVDEEETITCSSVAGSTLATPCQQTVFDTSTSCIDPGISNIVKAFGIDMTAQIQAKKKRLESITRDVLKTTQKEMSQAWLDQQDYRSQVIDKFQDELFKEVKALEKDIVMLHESEQKTLACFQQQLKVMEKSRNAQEQRVKNLLSMKEDFSMQLAKAERFSHQKQIAVKEVMREKIEKFQKQLLMENQKQELTNLRKSLHCMFMS